MSCSPRNSRAWTVGWTVAWVALLSLPVGLGLSGCEEDILVGQQCPSPRSGRATVAGDPELPAGTYGTTCAPCDDGDEIELDADGCPVFVTFESCGGDVCLGGIRIPESIDAGMIGRDAATDAAVDAASDEEDGGA